MAETRIDRRRVLVRRACALIIGTAFFAAVGGQGVRADEAYIANPKPPTDGRVGANYTPAYTVNQVQFWHDFRAAAVEEELAAAQEFFGISTLRVYLHNINFDEEKNVLLANLEKFLTICEARGIKPGFVFFDDCHREDGIFLDKPTTPVKGFHNGRWAPGKPKLVAPRAYMVSPFPEDAGRYVYFAGFDCNFFPALDTAWAFRTPMETVLSADP